MRTDMDEQHPLPPENETRHSDADSAPGFDRFVEGQATLESEIGQSIEPPRPSRKSAWLAMAAVAVALGLLWLAPGIGHGTAQEQAAAGSANGAADAAYQD